MRVIARWRGGVWGTVAIDAPHLIPIDVAHAG
jgi:hypothetical protein